MTKFITQYHCWATGRDAWIVICVEERNHEQAVITADKTGLLVPYDCTQPLPDVRLFNPVRFLLVPPTVRGTIRAWWQGELELAHGAEGCGRVNAYERWVL